ncbi:MAG: DUF6265 family protein [Pseudomonadota bacterium]
MALTLCTACAFQTAALAQDASTAEAVPPPVTLADVAWLIGDWEGAAEKGVKMYENWQEPVANLMINTYVETEPNAVGQETVSWTEFSHLWEENGTLYFKVFSLLAGEQPIIGPLKLVRIEPCLLAFETVTYRCADADKPGEGLVATYIEEVDGERKEHVLTYKKADRD